MKELAELERLRKRISIIGIVVFGILAPVSIFVNHSPSLDAYSESMLMAAMSVLFFFIGAQTGIVLAKRVAAHANAKPEP